MVYFALNCFREVILASSHFKIFKLFILLKYVLEKLFLLLPISASFDCLFCLNIFLKSYFGIFAFQHLAIVYFALLCFRGVSLTSPHFSIFEWLTLLKYILPKLFWHICISTSSNCFFCLNIF